MPESVKREEGAGTAPDWRNALKLRPAKTREDAEKILEWRNDPRAREVSAFSQIIPWETHWAWFSKKAADGKTLLFIAEFDGEDIGMVCVDVEGNGKKGVVSINVAPKRRGKGIGSKMLAALVEYCKKNTEIKTLAADVLPSNPASLMLFSAAGFAQIGLIDINGKQFAHVELGL